MGALKIYFEVRSMAWAIAIGRAEGSFCIGAAAAAVRVWVLQVPRAAKRANRTGNGCVETLYHPVLTTEFLRGVGAGVCGTDCCRLWDRRSLAKFRQEQRVCALHVSRAAHGSIRAAVGFSSAVRAACFSLQAAAVTTAPTPGRAALLVGRHAHAVAVLLRSAARPLAADTLVGGSLAACCRFGVVTLVTSERICYWAGIGAARFTGSARPRLDRRIASMAGRSTR